MSTPPSNNAPESGNSYTPPPVANYGVAETPAPAAPYSAAPLNVEADSAAPALAAPKSKIRPILSVLGILLVVAVFGWRAYVSYTESAALTAGQCIVVEIKSSTTSSNGEQSADHKGVDCADTKTFSYYITEVVASKGACADGAAEYSLSAAKNSNKAVKVACLIPNLHEGVCYKNTNPNLDEVSVAACSEAAFKVSQVLDSATAQCAENEKPVSFTKPARTYCIADPKS